MHILWLIGFCLIFLPQTIPLQVLTLGLSKKYAFSFFSPPDSLIVTQETGGTSASSAFTPPSISKTELETPQFTTPYSPPFVMENFPFQLFLAQSETTSPPIFICFPQWSSLNLSTYPSYHPDAPINSSNQKPRRQLQKFPSSSAENVPPKKSLRSLNLTFTTMPTSSFYPRFLFPFLQTQHSEGTILWSEFMVVQVQPFNCPVTFTFSSVALPFSCGF